MVILISRRVLAVLGLLVLVALPLQAAFANTTVLYDGAITNSLPGNQAFDFIAFPSEATQTWASGATTLDTSSSNGISAGYFTDETGVYGSGVLPVLDRTAGFSVQFTAQVMTETHTSNNRAGFSIIVLSDDQQGIELGFWTNEIWAQNGPPSLFTHGEGVSYNTTTGLTQYTLEMSGSTYTLKAAGATILTGAVRDYTSFGGFPDVYETPNFIFLGDDTTSASAQVRVSAVSVTTNTGGGGTATFTPSATPSATATASPTASNTPTATNTATPTATNTTIASPTNTLTPSATRTLTPTVTNPPPTSTFTRTATPVSIATASATLMRTPTATLTRTSTTVANASATPTSILNPVLRINAGGPTYSSWQADLGTGGTTVLNVIWSKPSGTNLDVANTIVTSLAPNAGVMQIYQSAYTKAGGFSYTISNLLPNQTYLLRLHFSENWNVSRSFSVSVNGAMQWPNQTIASVAGGMFTAYILDVQTTAEGMGQIIIQFTPGSGDPIINGMELVGIDESNSAWRLYLPSISK